MVPRVLVVLERPDADDRDPYGVEWVVAPDGDAALELLAWERFDAVVLDLALAPLDGWCVLAALGLRADRPRLIVTVPTRGDVARAQYLGADLCVLAGTPVNARALQTTWRQHPKISSPRPTTSGVPV